MKSEIQKLTRREMVEKLFAGIAAGAVWPVVALSHPLRALLKDGVTLDRADAADHAADWKPLFLNAQQNQTLVDLAETIVPGSTKAQVNRFIDLLLSVDTKESGEKFLASLATIQSASQEKFTRGFGQLTASEKEQLLTSVSADPVRQKHFEDLKEWVSLAYYSSEEGMRELGWTGQHAFRTFPECTS
jgi:hypothetical protein